MVGGHRRLGRLHEVVSLTGLVPPVYLKLRRRPGMVVVLVGAVVAAAAYFAFVP